MRVLISSRLVSKDLSKPTGPSLPLCSCLDLSVELSVDDMALGPSIEPDGTILAWLYQNGESVNPVTCYPSLVRLSDDYRY